MYSQRDKTQDKVWPKGTVETMQKQMNIMQETAVKMYQVLQANGLWPPPTPRPFPAAEAPPVHDIAAGMGCMPVGEPRDLTCNRHETVAGGILRVVGEQECQRCLEEQVMEGNDTKSGRTEAWSRPEHAMLKQPINKPMSKSSNHGLPNIATQGKTPAYPSQSLSSSPFVSLKQEESALDMPKLYSAAPNQHISPYPSQGTKPQRMRQSAELDSMGNNGYSRNMLSNADLPTPTYSEPDFLNDYPYQMLPGPPTNNPCTSAVFGPQCYEDCGPFSSIACRGSANLQQFLPHMGGADTPMDPFVQNNEAGMAWDNLISYSQPNM